LRPRLAAAAFTRDLVGHLGRRLAPGEIFVDRVDGDIDTGLRRPAEIKRWTRRLDRREQQPSVLDADVLTFEIDGLAGEKLAVDVKKLSRHRVARIVVEEDAVARVLDGIPAGDDVDQQPPVR
jgi:hypothetical protein